MTSQIDLAVGGMTCASCASRVERSLARIPGVSATVNLATATASVSFPDDIGVPELIGSIERAGYTADRPSTDTGPSAIRVGLCIVLTVPVLLLEMVFDGPAWLSAVLCLPVVAWGGWPFHRAAWKGLQHRTSSMDTLVSLGTVVAFAAGSYEVAAAIVTFLVIGRLFEAKAKHSAGSALRALLELTPDEVSRVLDGVETRIPVSQLRVGDDFLARPGEAIATDGLVLEGHSAIDAGLLTGESLPVDRGPGAEVTGATINAGGGLLLIRANAVGADTRVAQIGRLVAQAQAGKAPVQRLADRVSAIFVPSVFGLALVTLLACLPLGLSEALSRAVAVLVVACPCALGLATPTALLVGTGRGAQLGLLIKGPEVLEATRRITTVVLDKTGTVTTGHLQVGAVTGDPLTLRLAAAVEVGSEHPVGRAIAAAYRGAPAVSDFQASPGLGVRGVVEGRDVAVGRAAYLRALGLDADGDGLLVAWGGEVRATIEVTDTVKDTSVAAVAALVGLGLRPVLLTGDSLAVASAVATEVGISDVRAEVLPEDKVAAIRELQARGEVVAMVGDGVNDAAALAQADLGMSMGTGTDVAIAAADITIVNGDLQGVPEAIRLSRRTLRTIKINLGWAFAYNVAGIPLAALGVLPPVFAGLAMAASSLLVVVNSSTLKRFR